MHVRTVKELKALNLNQLSEIEYYSLQDGGLLHVYFPEATGIFGEDMKRIDVIGHNSNDGEHYDTSKTTGVNEQKYVVSDKESYVSGWRYPDGSLKVTERPIGWPHVHSDDYSDKVKKVVEDVYDLPKDGMFVDDYIPDDPTSPSHYELGSTGVEAIDVIEASLTKEEYIGYLRGNILKYQLRSNKKNGNEDLRKADIYSGWLVEALEE